MVYDNTVTLLPAVMKNLREFCANKSPEKQVFDMITPDDLNHHFDTLMKGLTAKVFRTYNASITLQNELANPTCGEQITKDSTDGEKVLFYNRANREVSILCNHQRSVPKAFDGQMLKMEETMTKLTTQLDLLQQQVKNLTKGSKTKIKVDEEVVGNFSLPDTVSACKTKIDGIQKRIDNHQTKITLKSDTKTGQYWFGSLCLFRSFVRFFSFVVVLVSCFMNSLAYFSLSHVLSPWLYFSFCGVSGSRHREN